MTIQLWPSDERPREKLLSQGVESLSVAELLAIFLRTGVKGKSALDLARDLLQHFGSLRQVLLATPKDFQAIPGLGLAKYAQIHAILELNKRYFHEEIQNVPVLENSVMVGKYLFMKLAHRAREVFACLFLNTQLKLISYQELFYGGLNETEIHPGEVVKAALFQNAAFVILAHNHPSGNLLPSEFDIQVTKNIKAALELVEIKLLDHFIVSQNGICSLIESGRL